MLGRRFPRIADVRPIVLRAAIERPVAAAFGTLQARNGVLVEVTTDAGLTGIGESWVNFPAWAPTERCATLVHGLRPLLVGEVVDDPRRLLRKCVAALHRVALQWGAVGPVYQALSGVDIALWDLAGKREGVPIWMLLGASKQETVPAYASGLGPDQADEQATKAMSDGFGAVKLKVGFGRDSDERHLHAVRKAIGGSTLFSDANQSWSLAEARVMAPLLAGVDAAWIEEPLAVDDEEGWDGLPGVFSMPVAGGENLYGLRQFERWCSSRLGVAQPDVCKCGGITAAVEIFRRVAEQGVRLAPHYLGGAVGLAATIHLFASLPAEQRVLVECDVNPNPLREELLSEPLLAHGRLRVPDGPGLGIELHQPTLERYGLTV